MDRRRLNVDQKNLELRQVSTVDLAADYAGRLIAQETHALGGDTDEAMRRVEAKYGVGYWTLWGLRYKRPKAVSADLFTRLRGAYLSACERQLANLQHEIAIERARCGHDLDADLLAEAETLLAKIKTARAR
jgi:hypothetical protein